MDVVAVNEINRIRTPLAAKKIKAIKAILGIPNDMSVHTVLVADATEDQVAILRVVYHVAVTAVLGVHVHDVVARDLRAQFRILVKKGSPEVKVAGICSSIPGV